MKCDECGRRTTNQIDGFGQTFCTRCDNDWKWEWDYWSGFTYAWLLLELERVVLPRTMRRNVLTLTLADRWERQP